VVNLWDVSCPIDKTGVAGGDLRTFVPFSTIASTLSPSFFECSIPMQAFMLAFRWSWVWWKCCFTIDGNILQLLKSFFAQTSLSASSNNKGLRWCRASVWTMTYVSRPLWGPVHHSPTSICCPQHFVPLMDVWIMLQVYPQMQWDINRSVFRPWLFIGGNRA
jgi:hypothetical protein